MMPLSTYSELKSAVADFLNRDDLTAVIPTFIALTEADINRTLRDYRMEKRSDATLDAQYSALPNDWLETIRLQLVGSTSRLELAPDGALADLRAARGDLVGKPTHYAHTAGGLELYPTPDGEYTAELVYFAKAPALSDTVASNWLLTAAPDAYLYGALTQSAPYLKDDQRAVVWAGLYQNAINNLNSASERARYSGSGLRLRNRGMA
jgi:hypothetical protein